MGKALETPGRVLPYYVPLMAAALTDYIDSFGSDDENYYENRKQNREQFAASIRKQMEEDYNMRGLTRSDAMNNHIHKELKVRLEKMHGSNWEEVYKTNYLTEQGREIPFISENLATQLDDYAYVEVPTTDKLLYFAMENSALGGILSGGYIKKSISVAEKVRDIRAAGSYQVKRGLQTGNVLGKAQIDALSDRQIEMIVGIDESANAFTAYLNKRLYGIGNGMGIVGKADLGANELRQINTITNLTNRISTKLAEIKGLRIQGLPKTDPQVVKLRNEVTGLIQAKNNQTVLRTIRRSPIYMGNQKDELLVAFGQAYGYDLGSAIPYLSPEGGELLGALTMAFHLHSRPMGAVGSVLHFADRALNDFFDTGTRDTLTFIDNMGSVLNNIDPRLDISGSLVNRDLETLQQSYFDSTGKTFTTQQTVALKQLTNLTKNMPTAEREKLVGFLKDSHARQERLVKAFPPELQEEAREIYKQTFGSAAQIPGVLVYEGSLSSRLHVNDLDNFNIKELNMAASEALAIVRQNELFAKRFLDLGEQGKLNPDDFAELETFVNQTKEGVAGLKQHMQERAIDFEKYIDLYFKNIMTTPTNQASVAFDKGMLQDIIDGLTNIRAFGTTPVGEGASLVNQTEIMKKTHDEVINKAYNYLFEAASAVDGIKHTTDGVRYSELIAEKLYDLRYNEMHARGKLAYAKVDALLRDERGNITNLAEGFFEEYERLSGEKINFAFGVDGSFARSTHGRKLLRVMNNITRDTLGKVFDGKDLQEFRTYYYEKYGRTPTDTQLYFILKNPEDQKQLGIEGLEMPDITASFYEIEEMRKYFRDLSFKYEKNDPAGIRMSEFSNSLNTFLETNSKNFPELAEARKTYQNEVFYPTDKGELLSEINKSVIRREDGVGDIDDRIAMASTSDNIDVALSFKYAKKAGKEQSPEVWFDNLTTNLIKYAETSDQETLDQVQKSLRNILVAFGDRIDTGVGNPTYGIKLGASSPTAPDRIGLDKNTLGSTKFKLLQKVVEARVYQKWAKMRAKSYEDATTSALTRKGSNILADVTLPKFTATKENIDKLEDILEDQISNLQQAFIIPIQLPDGKVRSIKLIDLDRMLERERDISKIVMGFEEGAESFKALDNQWQIFLDQNKVAAVTRKSKLEDEALSDLNTAIKGSDGKGFMNFYEDYIANSSPSRFAVMRNLFTKGVQAGPEKLDSVMSEEVFDKTAINALVSGIFSKSKYTLDKHLVLDLDGKMTKIKTFEDPMMFINEFQKDNIQMIAKEIMGNKHVEDANVILDAMHREISANAYRSLRGTGMGGLTRPISPNEIISRAFNLARGMVSPAYVTAEMLLRIASTNNIEVTRLILQDKEIASVFSELMTDPKGFDVQKVRPIVPRLQEFVFSELLAKGKVSLLTSPTNMFDFKQGEEDENIQ